MSRSANFLLCAGLTLLGAGMVSGPARSGEPIWQWQVPIEGSAGQPSQNSLDSASSANVSPVGSLPRASSHVTATQTLSGQVTSRIQASALLPLPGVAAGLPGQNDIEIGGKVTAIGNYITLGSNTPLNSIAISQTHAGMEGAQGEAQGARVHAVAIISGDKNLAEEIASNRRKVDLDVLAISNYLSIDLTKTPEDRSLVYQISQIAADDVKAEVIFSPSSDTGVTQNQSSSADEGTVSETRGASRISSTAISNYSLIKYSPADAAN